MIARYLEAIKNRPKTIRQNSINRSNLDILAADDAGLSALHRSSINPHPTNKPNTRRADKRQRHPPLDAQFLIRLYQPANAVTREEKPPAEAPDFTPLSIE